MKRDLLEELLRAKRARRTVALATDLETGEQWVVDPEAASLPEGFGPDLLRKALHALAADRAGQVELAGRRLFLNVFPPPLRLLIVGAVHVAQPLAQMARLADFDPCVIDPRRAYATESRFPGVSIVRRWPDEALMALAPDRRSAVVTLSHDPKLDDPALAVALRSEAFYIGCLGSRRTHARRLERLREAGFDGESLARIQGPVGLPIGARSPAEIAASILAEAIARLRLGAEAALSLRSSPVPPRDAAPMARRRPSP